MLPGDAGVSLCPQLPWAARKKCIIFKILDFLCFGLLAACYCSSPVQGKTWILLVLGTKFAMELGSWLFYFSRDVQGDPNLSPSFLAWPPHS